MKRLLLIALFALAVGSCETPVQKALVNNPSFAIERPIAVTYEIKGTAKAVSLTWENDTGGTNQGDYKVPFKWIRSFPADTWFLYISAQIIEPTIGSPEITCRILADGIELAKAEASGFASIATCSW